MPLKRCSKNGKSGWKYGDSGHCYTGPGAKRKAIKQGVAIDGPNFESNATEEELKELGLLDKIEIGLQKHEKEQDTKTN